MGLAGNLTMHLTNADCFLPLPTCQHLFRGAPSVASHLMLHLLISLSHWTVSAMRVEKTFISETGSGLHYILGNCWFSTLYVTLKHLH
jgi:hypothetical protein